MTPAANFSLRRAIALNEGIALWWCWEATDAERAFREAADLAEAGGERAAAIVARSHLARIRCDQGYLDQSWAMFQEAVSLAEQWNVAALPSQSFVHLGMAYVLIERNQLDDAEACLEQCITLGTAGGKLDHVALAHVDQGQRPGEVDCGTEIGRDPGCPERPPESDRFGQEAPPVDDRAPGRADDRWVISALHDETVPRVAPECAIKPRQHFGAPKDPIVVWHRHRGKRLQNPWICARLSA